MKFLELARGRDRTRGWLLRGSMVATLAGVAVLVAGSSAYGFAPLNRVAPANRVATPAKALTNITIAYTAPVADQMLLPVTETSGLFKKNGVKVTIKFLSASLALPALIAGQVQFVVVGAPSAEIATIGGTPVTVIGSWEHNLDAEIVAPSSYKTPKSLNGKPIAISAFGSFADFLVRIADHQYGIQMHEVPLGNLTNEETAYVHGEVQAISGANIWQIPTLAAAVPGTHVVVDFRKDKGYPGSGSIIADGNWLKKKANGKTAVKVLTALAEGVHYYKTHESKAVSVIATNTSEPTSEAKEAYQITRGTFTNNVVPTLQDEKDVLKALGPSVPGATSFNAKRLFTATYATKAEAAALATTKKKK